MLLGLNPYNGRVITFNDWTGPIINSVSMHRYVFSDSFYKNIKPTCLLEKVLMEYYETGEVNSEAIAIIVNDYKNWPLMERYYYGPVTVHLANIVSKVSRFDLLDIYANPSREV